MRDEWKLRETAANSYVDGVVDVLLVAIEHVQADGERLDAALRASVARLLLLLFLLLLVLLLLLLVGLAISVLLLALLLDDGNPSMDRRRLAIGRVQQRHNEEFEFSDRSTRSTHGHIPA